MSYVPRSLFRLVEDMDSGSLLLPHIQRAFVWDEDQMVRLFDSLMRDYPIQTLLFWKTREQIRTRRFMTALEWDCDLSSLYDKAKSAEGVEKTFVLAWPTASAERPRDIQGRRSDRKRPDCRGLF